MNLTNKTRAAQRIINTAQQIEGLLLGFHSALFDGIPPELDGSGKEVSPAMSAADFAELAEGVLGVDGVAQISSAAKMFAEASEKDDAKKAVAPPRRNR